MNQIIDESRGLLEEEEKGNRQSKEQSGLLYIDSMILKSKQKDQQGKQQCIQHDPFYHDS